MSSITDPLAKRKQKVQEILEAAGERLLELAENHMEESALHKQDEPVLDVTVSEEAEELARVVAAEIFLTFHFFRVVYSELDNGANWIVSPRQVMANAERRGTVLAYRLESLNEQLLNPDGDADPDGNVATLTRKQIKDLGDMILDFYDELATERVLEQVDRARLHNTPKKKKRS